MQLGCRRHTRTFKQNRATKMRRRRMRVTRGEKARIGEEILSISASSTRNGHTELGVQRSNPAFNSTVTVMATKIT